MQKLTANMTESKPETRQTKPSNIVWGNALHAPNIVSLESRLTSSSLAFGRLIKTSEK